MDNLFTRDDIDLAIAGCHTFLNSGLLEQPEIIRGYRESVDLTGETKKTLNLLENVLHWMKKAEAAPQAQEEPSGAPAPEPQSPRKGWTWIPGHWLRWWESGSATVWPNGTWHTFDSDGGGGENASDPTIGEAMDEAEKAIKRQGFDQATEDEEEPQPPAPASPGRECWVLFGPSGGTEAVRAIDQINDRTMALANGLGWKWVRMVEAPAAPEAGAPGTQGACLWTEVADGDGYFESSCGVSMAFQEGGGPKDDADYIHCQKCGKKIELDDPPTQTQEGGSQP